MNPSILRIFEHDLFTAPEVEGKRILEVGAFDVNGSVRPILEALHPKSYIGLDVEPGPGVDRLGDCHSLINSFGLESYDIVITTEMLEHVRDWRTCMINLTGVVTLDGILALSTRSPGYGYHWKVDYWRFPVKVMRGILTAAGMEVLYCEPDPESPGVIAKGRKVSRINNLSHYNADVQLVV